MSEKPNYLKSDELNSSTNKKSRDGSSSNERPDRRQTPDRRGPSQIRSYLENDLIFPENEIGNEAFIIKTGSIEIFKTLYKDGKKVQETVLGTLGEGSLFGEMALIEDEKRMAGARAIGGGVSVYVISRSQFKEKLKPINPFIVRLIQVLAENVRRSADKLFEE
jgi:CRP-like cAMP-binding protein